MLLLRRYSLLFLLLNVCVVVPIIVLHAKKDEISTLKELYEQFEKSIKILLGTDTRLIRVDITRHTSGVQPTFCPSALPIAMNAILTHANPTTVHHNNDDNNLTSIKNKVLIAAMEICILCITNNPTNRIIFSDGHNIDQQSYTIHASIVSLLKQQAQSSQMYYDVIAKASHLIWIASFSNPKNHLHFIQADVINALSNVILSIPYPITDTTSIQPLVVMWASAALQNLAASYCDKSEDGTCEWDWYKHEDDVELGTITYNFDITDESGTFSVDSTEVRQAIALNTTLLHRLLQWTCHGPVSGSMTFDNPFPGRNAISIHEHETSMNIVPWAALGALSNIALDTTVKTQLLYHYGVTMPCFCYMSQSPDWLEAVKGQAMIHHLRYDKDPCWFDFHESEKEHEEVLCVDRLFTDIAGSTCHEYSDPTTLNEEDCMTPDIHNDHILANMACCLCNGGDHYPKINPINVHELNQEEYAQSMIEHHSNEEYSEHDTDYSEEEEEDFSEYEDGEEVEVEEEEVPEEEL